MSLTRSSKRSIKARRVAGQAANQPMLVTADEAHMLLRLRQLANAGGAEARVVLPELRVTDYFTSEKGLTLIHGSVYTD